MKIKYIDGKRFSRGIRAGAKKVVEHQEHLNKINVFPVPDADTGTNMAATMKTVVDNLSHDTDSIEHSSTKIADSALEGARGNSGVILAQFFYGLAKGLRKHRKVNTEQFAAAADAAQEHAYRALSKPKDGTILTVIRDWAENIKANARKHLDFDELLTHSLEAARRSLERTRTKLEALRTANVVDSGAQGFVYMLEGITHFIKTGHIRDNKAAEPVAFEEVARTEVLPETITFRYCTECLIEGKNIDHTRLRAQIETLGDSLVLAGSEKRARLHIHTNEPAKVFKIAHAYGDLLQQKADDMLKQYIVSHHPHPPIAIVADSGCDLPEETLDKYGIQLIPVRVAFGNSAYIDKITITADIFYEMLDTEPHHPKTSQPSPADFKNTYSFLLSHYDSIISIHLPAAASGTYQNAVNAAREFPDRKISVIDSKSLSVTFGLIVEKAAELVAAGKTHDEVVEEVTRFTRQTQIFVNIPSLRYLMRSGRVSITKGVIAKLLNLKPILNLDERGVPKICGKSFSDKGAIAKVLDLTTRFAQSKKNPRFVITHANALETAKYYCAEIRKRFNIEHINILPASPTLGAHAGNGAAAIGLSWSE